MKKPCAFQIGDEVEIFVKCLDGRTLRFPVWSRVVKIGHKWITVNFGNENIFRRFGLSGRGLSDPKGIQLRWWIAKKGESNETR